MSTFSAYSSTQPDIRDEILASKTNPLEPGRQYTKFVAGGVVMFDPEWEMGPMATMLEAMTDEMDFGDSYDYLPDKLSNDLYGTHELWLILMHINGAKQRSEFRGPRLKYITSAFTAKLLDIVRFGVNRAATVDARGPLVVNNLTVRTVYST